VSWGVEVFDLLQSESCSSTNHQHLEGFTKKEHSNSGNEVLSRAFFGPVLIYFTDAELVS